MAEESKKKVTVKVAARKDFPGVWCAGKLWPTGTTTAELSDAEVAKLSSYKGVVVTEGAVVTAPAAAPTNLQAKSPEAVPPAKGGGEEKKGKEK